jgi:dTDP-4-amino-4,6-dideoxygalactose transaminase
VAELASTGATVCIVHTTLGFVPEYKSIIEAGITVIEDISEGIGAHNGEQKCGTFGTITIIAMEVENVITSGGGVVIASGSRKESVLLKRYSREFSVESLLPDMNAALGLTQVQDIERYIQRRREIAGVYVKAVMASRHGMLSQAGDAENVFYSFPIVVESGMVDCIQYAKKNGVETMPAFENSILARYGTEICSHDKADKQLPGAFSLLNRCLLFPCYPSLGNKEVSLIQKILTTLP